MNPNREEVLFVLALEKPPEKRAVFLDVMCDGDQALRQRLDALLAAHEQPDTVAKVDYWLNKTTLGVAESVQRREAVAAPGILRSQIPPAAALFAAHTQTG